ncbi:UDP-N-acetylglucosamine transferase subunit ALG14-like protein [Drosera capensis]
MEKHEKPSLSLLDSNPFLLSVIAGFTLISIRFLYVLNRTGKPVRGERRRPVSTLIVLGSGGHTAEMLNLLTVLQKDRFSPRYYIAATTDNMSLQKAHVFENSSNYEAEVETARFMQIYRSREVGQSYVTSIGTTFVAIAHALWLIIKTQPQVIICNGPGTCIPLCLIAFLFKVVGFKWSSIFYVESIARVRRLSLSGLLLYKLRIADQLYVQWPQLQRKYPGAIYVGCLIRYF